MLGIIGAMDEEIVAIKNEMQEIEEVKIKNIVFYKGKMEGKEVVLVLCGIGKVNAAIHTTLLINNFNIDKIIVTGVAGGINPELEIGDFVISKDLIQHDVDATAFGAKLGEIPRMETSTFLGNQEMVKISKEILDKSFLNKNNKIGRILSGDQFIASTEKIEMLIKIFKGDCVEMEGAAVAQVCHIFGIDFVVLRLISDKANSDAKIDFVNFIREAVLDFVVYIKELIKRI